jgi:hypothetical protein
VRFLAVLCAFAEAAWFLCRILPVEVLARKPG